MTVLTAIQNACGAGIPLNRPDAVFSTQDREHLELQVLANTAAGHIAKDNEWQALKRIAAIEGDGVADDFSFPEDYDRMLKQAELRGSRHTTLTHITSSDQWLDLAIRQFNLSGGGAWTIY